MTDVVVVGAGHNGLVAATLLARAGLKVEVVERDDIVGGACRTEHPFAKAPALAASTGAYLLGLMPPELIQTLQLDLPLVRRDPHYFLPTHDGRALLLGADSAASQRAVTDFASAADADALDRMGAELAALRDDLAPAWLAEPLPLEETAARHIRPELRDAFVHLVRGSAMDYLHRFEFESETLIAMYAVTDGMPGLTGSPWSPGSGHNLLVHNMCRLPDAGGTWMVVRGGMGTVTRTLAAAATEAGAHLRLGQPVDRILTTNGSASGVQVGDDEIAATTVLVATDPFRLPDLLGDETPGWLRGRVRTWAARSAGQTMKVNLALSELPTFTAMPEDRGQHGTTVHLLPPPDPDDGSVLSALRRAFDDATAGRLLATPAIEWYLHSTLDDSLRDDEGRHSSALFVQGVPHEPIGTTWEDAAPGYVDRLLDIVDGFAPGFRASVVDTDALPPPEITRRFGITGGNIDHVDNAFAFTERMPYDVGVPGVYAGAAGCHPAGSVIGCAGHNAAQRILRDLA